VAIQARSWLEWGGLAVEQQDSTKTIALSSCSGEFFPFLFEAYRIVAGTAPLKQIKLEWAARQAMFPKNSV